MHIDINSCFATIEQQANPSLRGKPVVVAAYTTDRGCILAASREAKFLGIKTGMMVGEAKTKISALRVLSPDPEKYRWINKKLTSLLTIYSEEVNVKSIDEMVIDTSAYQHMKRYNLSCASDYSTNAICIAKEIKQRIRKEIGEWITVSIGIAPNTYLAKIASNIHKPDGLDIIAKTNIEQVLQVMTLETLCGIKQGYGTRLRTAGIKTPLEMYHADKSQLRYAFGSSIGYDWWLWLHGWESDFLKNHEAKSIGHSYALPQPFLPSDTRLFAILCQLVEKMGRRLRKHRMVAYGIHISCVYHDHHWSHGQKGSYPLAATHDLYKQASQILAQAPCHPVRLLAVTCYLLQDDTREQLSLFVSKKEKAVTEALDAIADKWGEFTVYPASILTVDQRIQDRIAFGKC